MTASADVYAAVKPLPISVPIIASNEAARLPRVLASVAGWVSEIVVVLNNSTDESEAIARSFGARIERSAWLGYRDTKNIALGCVSQPWVLALDSDEEVSPALRAAIAEFFRRGDDQRFVGARFPRKVWFLGRWITHGDWYPDLSLRLFRREGTRWGGSPEHDKIELAGPVARLEGDLYHFSFPSITSFVGKINVFADYFLRRQIDAKKKFSAPNAAFRAFWRFFRCYIVRGGFLDGFPGFFIAAGVGFGALVRYSRLFEHEVRAAGREMPPPGV
jgi:glycosyltransferase involved in cell wall biosynthesis